MYSCCTVLYNQLLIVDWKKNLIDWKMLSHFQWSLYDNIGRWWRWYLRAHHINQINRRKILWRWAQEDTSMPRTLGTWLGFWRHNSRRSHMPKGSLRFFILYIHILACSTHRPGPCTMYPNVIHQKALELWWWVEMLSIFFK